MQFQVTSADAPATLPPAADELSALVTVLAEAAGSVYLLLDEQFRVLRASGDLRTLGLAEVCQGKLLAEACPELWEILGDTIGSIRDLSRSIHTQEMATAENSANSRVQHWRATCYAIASSTGGSQVGVLLVNITRQKALETALRDSEERFRGAFDTAPSGMALIDLNGHMIRVSRSLCEFVGYTKDELLGRSVDCITHPDDLQADLEQGSRLFRGEIEQFQMEKRYVRKDGRIVWGLLSVGTIRSADGKTVGCLGQIQDITDRKAAYEALHQQESRYRILAESIPNLVWIADASGGLEYINQRARDYVGAERVAELWPDWRPSIHPDDLPATMEHWQRSLRTRQPCEIEYRFQRADGEYRWHISRSVPIFDDDGNITQWFGTGTDIHTQKLAQQAIDASERRFRAILERSFDCVKLISAEGVVQYVSPSSSSLLGSEPGMRVGKPAFEAVHPDDVALVQQQFAAIVAASGSPRKWVYRIQHPDGTCHWHEAWGANLLHDPDVGSIVVNIRDVTQEKLADAAQQALRAERNQLLKRLQIQVETMPVGLIVTDEQFRIIEWNPAAEKIFGHDKAAVIGKRFQQVGLVPCDSKESIDTIAQQLQKSAQAAHGLHTNQTHDGRNIDCEWYLTPLTGEDKQFEGVLAMVVDVSERLHLEEQYRQAQKMEAVGRLAGGVAHDFNNLLTIINGYSELLLDEIEEDQHARSLLLEVQRAADRAARLTDQLLSFSRKQLLRKEVVDVRAILLEMKSMLSCLIGEDIELTIDSGSDLQCVCADKHQIEQVIMNLAANARDAMPQGGKLRLTLRMRYVDRTDNADRADNADQERLPPGAYVQLCVTDTGEGMDAETRERIFEPFFTTKTIGHGTGLGLSTVYGIIRQAGGRIIVESGPGRGTTFEILLPGVPLRSEASPSAVPLQPRGKGERILLVEDESSLRTVATQMLEQLGYEVVPAANGQEALRKTEAATIPFDLLLTDVVMPEMSGGELCQTLRQLRPDLKVIFMSGYTNDRLVQHDINETDAKFLQKPFSRAALAQIVKLSLAPAS